MKNILCLLPMIVWSCACFAQRQTAKEKLSIEFNENIATYSIVERLVAEHLGTLFYIDGKSNLDYLPMAQAASEALKNYDNSGIIQHTLDYLKITGQQQDLTYHGLLRSQPFPKNGLKYSFDGLDIDSPKLEALKTYIEKLRQFYIERKLEAFFDQNDAFIQGGIREVTKNLPPAYVNQMERYYGEEISEFKFFVNPFDVVPYDTDFWHGSGPKIKNGDRWIANMISSSYLPLRKETSIKNHKSFGFDHPSTINLLVTHEFGHSFVNPLLEIYQDRINRNDSLLTSYSGWKEKMDSLGYGYWPYCVTEHLVRLGEIRIAATTGNITKADELRNLHISKFSFILIPELERKIKHYESNRQKYKSLKAFIPQLLSVFDSISVDMIRNRLGLQTEMFTVTIEVRIPPSSTEIYITGNQRALGDWNPEKTKMTATSDSTRAITFETYGDLNFKITGGSWQTEKTLKGFEKGRDIKLVIKRDSTFTFDLDH